MRPRVSERAMTESAAITELCERIAWISSLLELRTTTDDAAREASTCRVLELYAQMSSLGGNSRQELLRERLGLSETELQIVWLLAALAIDSRTKQLMLMQRCVGPSVTIDALRRIVYGERPSEVGFRELSADGTLRRFGIIERNDGQQHDSEARWTWTLTSRVLAWLHGDERVDPAFDTIARIPSVVERLDDLAYTAGAVADARKAMASVDATIIVAGAPKLGRRTMLIGVAAEHGRGTLCIDCSRLDSDPTTFIGQLRGLARECRLLARLPILVNADALASETATARRLDTVELELASRLSSNVLVTTGPNRPTLRWSRPSIVIELDPPTSAERANVWRQALGAETDTDVVQLAKTYALAPAMIHRAVAAARARAGGLSVTADDLSAGVRSVLDDQLGHVARRVVVRQTWDDLVLPADQLESIEDLIARIRESAQVFESWGIGRKLGKGLGVSALFSGPPGTGKTMVAALIAKELRLELYQVDLAKVVSKWVGESERNLAKLFDAAEAGHAVLLFDEADTLFGKRTDVKSSNDRYANLETNYLLQRLESFTGVCLLTTNHEANIDPAFQRRLSLHLRFELPDVEERIGIWHTMLSTDAPVDPMVDVRQLARRFELSAGSIRNAMVRAAFFAADKKISVSMPLLERAARLELEAMGKISW